MDFSHAEGQINLLICGATFVDRVHGPLKERCHAPAPLTLRLRRTILGKLPFRAPSAVHLSLCLSRGFSPSPLSVRRVERFYLRLIGFYIQLVRQNTTQ